MLPKQSCYIKLFHFCQKTKVKSFNPFMRKLYNKIYEIERQF